MASDLRSIVECLFAAGYAEHEIVDYLAGPYGLPLEAAVVAVHSVSGPIELVSRNGRDQGR